MKKYLIAAIAVAAFASVASAQGCPNGRCPATPVRTVVRYMLPQQSCPQGTACPVSVMPPVATVQKSTVTTSTVTVQQNYATGCPQGEREGLFAKQPFRTWWKNRRHLLGGGCGM